MIEGKSNTEYFYRAADGQATAASARIKGTTVDGQECLLHLHTGARIRPKVAKRFWMVRYQSYMLITASII